MAHTKRFQRQINRQADLSADLSVHGGNGGCSQHMSLKSVQNQQNTILYLTETWYIFPRINIFFAFYELSNNPTVILVAEVLAKLSLDLQENQEIQ